MSEPTAKQPEKKPLKMRLENLIAERLHDLTVDTKRPIAIEVVNWIAGHIIDSIMERIPEVAAAPKLLQALKNILTISRTASSRPNILDCDQVEYEAITQFAEAAIAAATEET